MIIIMMTLIKMCIFHGTASSPFLPHLGAILLRSGECVYVRANSLRPNYLSQKENLVVKTKKTCFSLPSLLFTTFQDFLNVGERRRQGNSVCVYCVSYANFEVSWNVLNRHF